MKRNKVIQKSINGLKAQGKLAHGRYGRCFFYSAAQPGVTCGVGQLLKPEDRQEVEEGGQTGIVDSIPSAAMADALHNAGLSKVDVNLLHEIQMAHDYSETLDEALLKLEKLKCESSE